MEKLLGKLLLNHFTGSHAVIVNTPWASNGHKFYKYKDKKLIHINEIKNIKYCVKDIIQTIEKSIYKRKFNYKYIEPYDGKLLSKKILKLYSSRNKIKKTKNI